MKEQNKFTLRHTSTIRRSIFITFMLVVVCAVLCVWLISFSTFYISSMAISRNYAVKTSEQIGVSIEHSLDSFVDKLNRIASNGTILSQLYNAQSNQQERFSSYEIIEAINSIIGNPDGIHSVEICASSGMRIHNSLPITKGTVEESDLIVRTKATEGIVWSFQPKEIIGDSESYVIISKTMYYDTYSKEIAGYALMAVERDYFDQLCNSTIVDDLYSFVITKEGAPISQLPSDFSANAIYQAASFHDFTSDNKGEEHTFATHLGDEKYLVSSNPISLNQWYVLSAIPYSSFATIPISNIVYSLISVIGMIAICFFVSRRLANNIATPINSIISAMKRVSQGDFTESLDIVNTKSHYHEVNLMNKGFNSMQLRLNDLVNEISQFKAKQNELLFLKTQAELNALQQQINPHFLYNILESIFWKAYSTGQTEVAQMITALGNFFRTSVNRGVEFITVREEIANVKNYIFLQKIRFGKKFDIHWHIDTCILDNKILKLILQPVIENAIVHGFEQILSGGLITVSGHMEKNKLIFEVSDNGQGMDEKSIAELMEKINSPMTGIQGSVGVKNVHQRIKLYYGENYGIHIYPNLPTGLRVVLCLSCTIDTNYHHKEES